MIKKILENKDLFVPLIFTEKQFGIIMKRFEGAGLSGAEKKSFYTSIKKKMEALDSLRGEKENIFVQGTEHIFPGRILKAKEILGDYSKKNIKAFISGSFLFSKKFNDIDIFIIRKRGYKEEFKEKYHIIYLTEKKLADPAFQSAAKISVSNFLLQQKVEVLKTNLHCLMSTYHEAIIEMVTGQEKKEALRDLVFEYFSACRKILNGLEIKDEMKGMTISSLGEYYKALLKKRYSKNYLYNELHGYIKTLDESIKNIRKNDHLIHYKKIYEELIYESRRLKEKAY